MDEFISDIISYIKYLRETLNLSVSVHLDKQHSILCYVKGASNLITYSSHISPYCLKIKSDEHLRKKCLKCQQFTRIKCKKEKSFIGTCHADVTEYVRAIKHEGRVMGFVSVSGYRSTTQKIEKDENLAALYTYSTVKTPPPKEFLDKIIPPLCRALELLPLYAKKEAESEYLSQSNDYDKLLFYLDKNYASISLADLCKEFHKSASSISHMFKKTSGFTIKQYCNLKKINDAKKLLSTTVLSVSQIAEAVGFNDLSYFINVFKKTTGSSPLVWRNTSKHSGTEL